jgi:hypothetical protein
MKATVFLLFLLHIQVAGAAAKLDVAYASVHEPMLRSRAGLTFRPFSAHAPPMCAEMGGFQGRALQARDELTLLRAEAIAVGRR